MPGKNLQKVNITENLHLKKEELKLIKNNSMAKDKFKLRFLIKKRVTATTTTDQHLFTKLQGKWRKHR